MKTLAFGSELAAPAPADPAPGASAPADDPLVGASVGSFRVVRLLGRGGMGTVYLAEHPVIGSRVAVKFLLEAMASDAQVVARFYDEARAVNLIGHENIVGIYDLSVLPPNRYYFVMEYLVGETLAARQQRGPIPRRAALDVLLQLADALQCAHERGVVHRDLKPENVFLVERRGSDHFVKLVDFGIAKLRGARTAGRTEAGMIIGTPEYIAPEQCDDGAVDARTDVYSLGVMAFELVTGRLPFAERGVAQLLLAHLQRPPPRPSDLAPVGPALERAILRALAKDPRDRFPDMASFAEALRGAADEAPAAAAPAPTPPPVEVLVRAGPGAPRRLSVVELGRAALFLRAEADLPPLRSRVGLSLSHPALGAPLELAGEVVRHVSTADAAAWRMAPGFAVQLVDLAPEARAAIAGIADEGARRDRPPPRSAEAGDARLRTLESRAGEDHYAFLGLAPDAEFADVRRTARAIREELEALRARPLAADQPRRATALLARLEAAHAALGAPPSRLAYDAERGNARGVARCVAAGVPAELVAARREALLRAHPERKAEAARQLARAEVARKLGNAQAAAAAYEAALAADPLDLATLELVRRGAGR